MDISWPYRKAVADFIAGSWNQGSPGICFETLPVREDTRVNDRTVSGKSEPSPSASLASMDTRNHGLIAFRQRAESTRGNKKPAISQENCGFFMRPGAPPWDKFLVPTARLELAQLSPLPPQDSVSTNFTTSANFNQKSVLSWKVEHSITQIRNRVVPCCFVAGRPPIRPQERF